MDPKEFEAILHQLWNHSLTPEQAQVRLKADHMLDLGSTKLDLDRQSRCGFPEVIFAQGKTTDEIQAALLALQDAGQDALATRVNAEQGSYLEETITSGQYDSVGKTFRIPCDPQPVKQGRVVVISAGTTDLPVAQEAVVTAQWMGCDVQLIQDVGVAGPHRLPSYRSVFQDADAIVVLAGMEGALPSVVGGYVDCPVVAVPTSVGYGASLGGVAALLGMLNSCAANVTVVNIDAGFKGAYVAGLIAKRTASASVSTP